ncbi:formate--tetrahydrofolate ligase [Trueperella sp.]|uniref:formate--tetrahydrofolate ligase n=1 Tax=Trueperella sp. TaxID=2699835 RepID=UPI003735A44D
MLSDVEIAQSATLKPIDDIAASLGLEDHEFEPYGRYKAKLPLSVLRSREHAPDGKLVLVTGMSPTPAGEGKTTVNVGLSMALHKIDKSAVSTLREPSLGPVFGMKGGAAGGGYSQVLPMDDINLHFTGDVSAIEAANNLLSALIDNSIHHGNPLRINPKKVTHRRAIDVNDRVLREIVVGMGSSANGVMRADGMNIVPASEVMAILCLATDLDDLKRRLSEMIVAYTADNEPVTAADLGAVGAMAMLMKDAIKPNLVQTTENTPAIIHGGPFANIAHGCNSILATKMGLKLAEYTVTEAGFGADLGAEKFFDIVCPVAGFTPNAAVVVVTVRALRYNGEAQAEQTAVHSLDPVRSGLVNLERHLENLAKFGVPCVVAINRFPTDTDEEIEVIKRRCAELGVGVAESEGFTRGGDGATELAEIVVELCEREPDFVPLYDPSLVIKDKIATVAREIYRADGVDYTSAAESDIERLAQIGINDLPVCMAKTQYSFSDDPAVLGAPTNFRITVREVRLSSGAGFVVALTRSIITMPGLPKEPAALGMDIHDDGTVVGLS